MEKSGESRRIGAYVVIRMVGRGGMGEVYEAHDTAMKRTVALKLISPQLAAKTELRERFMRESRLAAAIDHPSIIPIYEAGVEDEELFIAMRLIEGIDLKSLIRTKGRLELPRAQAIIAQVAGALDAAHAGGLVHRDVKPANVLLGEGDRAYLTDFGLTREVEGEGLTMSGQFVGTFDYASPEQLKGESVGPPADVYALGCTLFEALTGQVPFPRETDAARLWAHMNEPPPSVRERVPELPEHLDEALAGALEKDPNRRFATAGELIDALDAASTGRPRPASDDSGAQTVAPGAGASPVPVATRPDGSSRPAGRRRKWLWVLGLLAVAAAGTVIALVLLTGNSAAGEEVPLPGSPGELAAGDGSLWVINSENSEVLRLDPESGQVDGSPIEVPAEAEDVAVSDGVVWVAASNGTVASFQEADPGQPEIVEVGGDPFGIAAHEEGVWVVDPGRDSLIQIDGASGEISSRSDVGPNPLDVAAGDEGVWVALESGAQEIDPDTGEPAGDLVRTSAPLESIAVGEGSVWASSNDGNVAFLIDPEDPSDPQQVETAPGPEGITIGDGSAWITGYHASSVDRFDVETGARIGDAIAVGVTPGGIAATPGAIWVANSEGRSLSRVEP